VCSSCQRGIQFKKFLAPSNAPVFVNPTSQNILKIRFYIFSFNLSTHKQCVLSQLDIQQPHCCVSLKTKTGKETDRVSLFFTDKLEGKIARWRYTYLEPYSTTIAVYARAMSMFQATEDSDLQMSICLQGVVYIECTSRLCYHLNVETQKK
jgi:hypothetical protein